MRASYSTGSWHRFGNFFVGRECFAVLVEGFLGKHRFVADQLLANTLNEVADLGLPRAERLLRDKNVNWRTVCKPNSLVRAALEAAHGDPGSAVDRNLLIEPAFI